MSANTEPRRDELLAELVDAVVSADQPIAGLAKVREIVAAIKDPDNASYAVLKVLDQIRRRRAVPLNWGEEVIKFL